jgi:hypothetical protein
MVRGVNGIDTSKIQGKISNVFYTNSANTVLISADKLYLYDLADNNVVSETTRESVLDENYIPVKDGYVMVGLNKQNNSGGGFLSSTTLPGYTVIFYDSSLKKSATINLSDLISDNEMIISDESISISQDGNLITFATGKGLQIYNRAKAQKTMLIDCAKDDNTGRKGISVIEQAAFMSGDKSIIFKAQSLDVPAIPNKQSFDTVGRVNIEGTELSNANMTENDKQTLAMYGLSVFNTRGAVFGSNGGKYYAVSEMTKNGIQVNVYSSSSGAMVYEKLVKEDSRHIERDPEIKILDESKSLIVLLGNRQSDITTIVVFDSF